LGAIDAVLVYIRARVRDVTLPGNTSKTSAVTATPADADTADERAAGDAGAIAEADEPAQPDVVDEHMDAAEHDVVLVDTDDVDRAVEEPEADTTTEVEPEPEDEAFDESQYSVETQAIIRTFKNASLRQRAPGEVAHTLHQ